MPRAEIKPLSLTRGFSRAKIAPVPHSPPLKTWYGHHCLFPSHGVSVLCWWCSRDNQAGSSGTGGPGLQTPANHVPRRPGPAQGSGKVHSPRDSNFGLGFPRLVIRFPTLATTHHAGGCLG